MASQNFRYHKIVPWFLFGVASIVAQSELHIPNQKYAQPIKQHSAFDENSYNFEYHFDDGSLATQTGKFDQIHAYGSGYYRFNVQQRLYELRYESDASGTRGILSYSAPTGEHIEEQFFAATTETPSTSPVQLSDYHFSQFRLKPNFQMESYFPSRNSNRPSFSCAFYVKGEIPSMGCQSYESQAAGKIGATVSQAEYQIPVRVANQAASQVAYLAANQVENGAAHQAATQSVTPATNLAVKQAANLVANPTPSQVDWQIDQIKLKVKTLESENHYDDSGDFIIKYVFNNGISLCDIGKLNADNTVNIHDGHIILDYKDFLIMWNYTSDAKQYNVLQINDDHRNILLPNGPHSEAQYTLKLTALKFKNRSLNTQVFSDGGNKLEVYREFIKVDGQPFVRAIIKLKIQYLGEINFEINEQNAYGEANLYAKSGVE